MRATSKATQKQQPSTVDTEDYSDVPEAAGTSWMKDTPSTTSKVSKDLEVSRAFSDTDLSEIDSWETMLSFVDGAFGSVVSAGDVLGTGFKIASEDDKMRLQGVPLMWLQWFFYEGEYGEFVAANVVQRHDNGSITKWVITDGSTGIRLQLKEYTKKTGRNGGLASVKGLTVSNYYFDEDTKAVLTKAEVAEYITAGKKPKPAHTFYIDTSA